MKNPTHNSTARIVFTFAFAAAALFMLILASQVTMPMRAVLIAIAISDIILLGLVSFGNKIPTDTSPD